jgi:adenylate kinase
MHEGPLNSAMKTAYIFPVDAILLLGPTGAGKSPLGDALAPNGLFNRHCHHLDFGSELRLAVSDRSRSAVYSTAELDFIHGVLEQGLLLENEHFPLARKIISLFLDRTGFSRNDILVLNGIPRHQGQAREMEVLAHILALVVLDCSADEIVFRIRNNVGGDRTERVDDHSELIQTKLATFRERTAPLIDHYERLGRRIYRLVVSRTMTPAEAYRCVSVLAAADPPVTFIAEPPQR